MSVPDYTLEDTLDFKFSTRRFSTGAPFAFASGAVEIYEDNSVTQITGAETLTLEFDGITGLHNLRVAATAANGFENGKSYHCVVSAGTVDSVSVVGEVVQQFSIGRAAAAVDLANATDGLGALKTLVDTVNTDLSNGTDGLGALKTLIDTVNTDLSNGTDGLGALKTLIDALNDLSAAQVNAEVDTALTDIGLDHLVAVADADNPVDNSIMAKIASATGDWSTFLAGTDSLEALQAEHANTRNNLAVLTDAIVLTSATIETVTSQTIFVIPATADAVDDDAYNGAMAVFIDGTDANQKSIRLITDYDATTRSVTVAEAPDFTITTADTLAILAATSAGTVWDQVITGSVHNIANSAGKRLRLLAEAGNYTSGFVFIDTTSGTAGTTDFENGTEVLPVDTIADANTVAGSIGLHKFSVAPGSAITFPGTQSDEIWEGRDWTLALASRDITGSFIFGGTVTGIGTATAGYEFEECNIGAVTLDNDGHFERCALSGTFTIGQAGTFTFHNCFTLSTTAVTIDFAAVGATAVHMFGFDGEIIFKNMAAGDTVHITGGGDISTSTCTAGTIDHDGFFIYTDAGGNVTEAKSDIEVNTDDILVDTSVTLQGELDGIQADTEDIQSRLPAALISGRMDSDVEAINNDTDAADKLAAHALETLPVTFSAGGSTTTAVLNQVDGAGASATDDVYIGRVLVFNNSTLNHQVAEITDYDGGTTTATISTVTTAPGAAHTARMI